jgi:hypothetical protein
MKKAMILAFSALLVTCFAGILCAQIPDLSGTWVGTTDFPNTPDIDPVTLILKKAGTSYTGSITVANAKEVALENFKVEDEDTISFTFLLPIGNDKAKVKARLDIINDKVEGNKLMGAWTLETGEYGSLDLARKK